MSSPEPLVEIGVPVFGGEAFLGECLAALSAQTHRNLRVRISIDGGDLSSSTACVPFLADPRFTVEEQPVNLGWAGNTSWLIAQNAAPFWLCMPQDDVVAPSYVETLLAEALHQPRAAIVFSDIVHYDEPGRAMSLGDVTGNAFARQLTMLHSFFAAVPFRGLVRAEALAQVGGVPRNPVGDFAADTVFVAAVARWGELRRVALPLYRKRYHANNTHWKWPVWPLAQRREAFTQHCRTMLREALLIKATPQERRLLLLAACSRLQAKKVGRVYLADLTDEARNVLLNEALESWLTDPELQLSRRLKMLPDGIRTLVETYIALPSRPTSLRPAIDQQR